MAGPVVSAIPYKKSYGDFENRGSEFVQSEEREGSIETLGSKSTSSFAENSNNGLKSRAIVVLSNTIRNVAIIETVRFVAIVGLVCSAFASVLLPALGFAAIAAGACVLKNNVIQLDEKTQKDSDAVTTKVVDRTLSRSPSITSQTSQKNGFERTMSREASLSPISEDNPLETAPIDIGEAFLNSLGNKSTLNIENLHRLLTICYSYLLGKTADMPKSLSRKGLVKDHNTQTYFEKKFKDCFARTNAEFKNSAALDDKGHQILAVNERQKSLENANPSLIMETVQVLHQQIGDEKNKHGNKTDAKRHADNAKHAAEYTAQLKVHEAQSKLHFAEDAR